MEVLPFWVAILWPTLGAFSKITPLELHAPMGTIAFWFAILRPTLDAFSASSLRSLAAIGRHRDPGFDFSMEIIAFL